MKTRKLNLMGFFMEKNKANILSSCEYQILFDILASTKPKPLGF